jgi:RNA polymerase sigma-70 factor (ECF subfamily)
MTAQPVSMRQSSPPSSSRAGSGATGADVTLPEVLRAAARGDERAWRTIVDLYARRVFALARSRLVRTSGSARGAGVRNAGDEIAEEVTQSVFATIAAKLTHGEYAEQGRFESWLFRVAMNRIRDEARRAGRHAEPTDPEMLDGLRGRADDGPSWEQQHTTLRALREAMESLGESDREVIELRHHAGMSFNQIAEMLDEPLGTLLARHHRALRKLKDMLAGEGIDEGGGS